MRPRPPPSIQRIPISRISIPSPRVRSPRIFKAIVDNIGRVGLKRPITVARRTRKGKPHYELACGQGRIEAFLALGQDTIPALVVDARRLDCLIMSLVENCARRQHTAAELLHDIGGLKRRGYDAMTIAQKTGLSPDYVKGILHLMDRSEERLLAAVEHGRIPVSVAVEIAEAGDTGVQVALQQAYEKKLLRGRKLILARRIVEQRRKSGKKIHGRSKPPNLSAQALLRAYQRDTFKKRLLVLRAEATRDTLLFVARALRELFADENFVNLLRAEGLGTLPRNLAERMRRNGHDEESRDDDDCDKEAQKAGAAC